MSDDAKNSVIAVNAYKFFQSCIKIKPQNEIYNIFMIFKKKYWIIKLKVYMMTFKVFMKSN